MNEEGEEHGDLQNVEVAEGTGLPPDKLYFKIGEVARIVGVKPYVLRYWESEFSVIKPGKTRSKHRLYRRKDVETLLRIKDLLHHRRFTIEGARRQLRQDAAAESGGAVGGVETESLREIRDALIQIRDSLS
ncbi:MAG TPA: MerR family transcriptional regulator [Candidatus Limnocylindrales bacterium]|nr:MerR family transcriptional regulator [Candidatus Limnocylindrales bacterium]